MIWHLEFNDKKAKDWFEKIFKKKYKIRLIHDHYTKEFGYEMEDFIYDAGYLGYAEVEYIVDKFDLNKHGIVEFRQLCLCDTNDFKKVRKK